MIDAAAVLALHDALIRAPGWPQDAPGIPPAALGAAAINHRCNALLWAAEDEARKRHLPDRIIVGAKRAIDLYNQQRNDAIERIDAALLADLGPLSDSARLNSETAGSIIDRLSILALRLHALHLQLGRDADHDARCLERVTVARQQRADLAGCLDALLADALAGRARWRVYRALKLYNDPRFRAALQW